MADPIGKIILRSARQVFIWPLEAAIVLLIFSVARLLPVAAASAAMSAVIGVIGPITPWQKRARRNLHLAMPELDTAAQNHVLAGMWRNFGHVIGEFPHVHHMPDNGRIEFAGLEHLENIDEGAFLIGAHIGNWELGPYAAIKAGHKVAAIYRPLNNPLLAGLLARRQANYGGDIFRKGREGALGMISALRKGQIMCLLVDQQLREGMEVPFFGHPAQTSIGHIKLAIKKKVPLMLMRTQRIEGCRFKVTISPPLDLPARDNDREVLAIATQINAQIEDWIKSAPDQWFWPHRRWGKNI